MEGVIEVTNLMCAQLNDKQFDRLLHKMAMGVIICFYHVKTYFGSYLSQILLDFPSIWVILKIIKFGPKGPNPGGSGSDRNPDRKARKPSPDRANNIYHTVHD